MRLLAVVVALIAGGHCFAAERGTLPDWIVASADGRVTAGQRFELVVIAPPQEEPPEELQVRLRSGADERIVTLTAVGVPSGEQRVYAGDMPANLAGPVSVELVGRSSSVLSLLVAGTADSDKLRALTGAYGEPGTEPPLSENDPMYFVVGARDGWSARFQLSFKYRLFDQASGFGKDQPWLSGLYFGYTQNSIWDLEADSKPFRDTSYRPSLFWRWERTDDKTWIDGLRAGFEHESNGKEGDLSRSVNILFVRPEWRWHAHNGDSFEFTPKVYGYLDKSDNPDIQRYRGYVDWRFRYDKGGEWIATPVVRVGTSGKGSLLLDVSKRVRDLKFGPVSGYLQFQYFTGYGEDILDYNVRRPSQLRIGFAIVP
ncbi:MAG TPA: phospholipase A [Burkholderiales bacterium]|nr:phospholipase A [Burkholderiales bacterium]